MTARSSALSARSNLSGMTPGDLIGLRLQAIADLDIETAQAADEELMSHRSSQTTQTVSDVKGDLEKKVEEAFQIYRFDCERIRTACKLRELQVRMETDDLFQESQRRHISELNTVEKEYALAVLREQRRPAKQRRECELQARRLALVRAYQSSIKMREQANVAEQAELEERRTRVDAHFEKVRQNVRESQKVELTTLNQKFNQGLDEVKTDLHDALDLQEKKLSAALRALLQKAMVTATASAYASAEKINIADDINTLFYQKVADISGIELRPLSPQSRAARSPTRQLTPTRERRRSPRITSSPVPASPKSNERLDDPIPEVTADVQSPAQDDAVEPEEDASPADAEAPVV